MNTDCIGVPHLTTPDAYTEILKSAGRSLTDIGINAIALSRADVLRAIETLRGSAVAILGGDVFKLVGGTPQHTYDTWYCNRRMDENLADFLQRSWDSADSYIRRYHDPGDGTMLYTLGSRNLARLSKKTDEAVFDRIKTFVIGSR